MSERDAAVAALAEAQQALREGASDAQRILMWATPVGKDYDEDTAFTEIRSIARELIAALAGVVEPRTDA